MCDQYLTNLPDMPEQGIHKLVITRALTIDWKHRDTEMYLRNEELVNLAEKSGLVSFRQLQKIRSMQLRFIYHISRSSFNKVNPNELVSFLTYFRKNNFKGCQNFNHNIFIDFNSLLNNEITDKKLISNSYVFSFQTNQINMIKFFIKNNLPMPKEFMVVSNAIELLPYLERNLSFVLFNDNTFNQFQQIALWLCNFHLFRTYENNNFSMVSFKSDAVLPKPL